MSASSAGKKRPEWTRRPEGGGRFAIWLIRTIAQRLGRGVARVLLYPITLYFLIRRGPERRASRAYLTIVLGRSATLVDVARHIHCFAATILDRVFLLGERLDRFDVRASGLTELHRVIDLGRGMLLLGSHLGSFEVLRALSLKRPDITVRVVLDVGHNRALTELLAALNPKLAASVIDASQDGTAIVLAIRDAVARGELVTLLGDRARAGEPTVRARFLGASAPFPMAPWLIASVLDVPVALCFGLYRGGNRYDLDFEVFAEHVKIPRRTREAEIAALVQRYADRLAHHALGAPYNWFNFYDFWQSEAPDARAALPATDPGAAVDGAPGAAASVSVVRRP
jgi:predicted LPLAT superfamily acyltransferase